MNDFNILLKIEDLVCWNCCKDKETSTITVTSSNQTINLKNNYILNIVDVSHAKFTVLIQNGIETIIRNVYTSYACQICLPNEYCTHLISISGVIS